MWSHIFNSHKIQYLYNLIKIKKLWSHSVSGKEKTTIWTKAFSKDLFLVNESCDILTLQKAIGSFDFLKIFYLFIYFICVWVWMHTCLSVCVQIRTCGSHFSAVQWVVGMGQGLQWLILNSFIHWALSLNHLFHFDFDNWRKVYFLIFKYSSFQRLKSSVKT